MLSNTEKNKYRSQLFSHLNGFVITPTAYCLHKFKVCEHILEEQTVCVTDVASKFNANEGYLNIALRLIASQGWLDQNIDNLNNKVLYSCNDKTALAFNYFQLYKTAVAHLKELGLSESPFEKSQILLIESYLQWYLDLTENFKYPENDASIVSEIFCHLEGVLIGPILVNAGLKKAFQTYYIHQQSETDNALTPEFYRLLTVLSQLNWFEYQNKGYVFTNKGLFFTKRASAYGVTISYQPTLTHLDELIFGDPLLFKNALLSTTEKHVNRTINVWGSGGAHTTYFKVIDEIIIKIFNKPIEQQPEGVLDMGCGNGAFLIHLFNVIEQKTLRGSKLEEYPLTLIGVDYNQAAIDVSKQNLIDADVWAKVIWGDISNPKNLADDLEGKFQIQLEKLLNVRTFLDHNRIWDTNANLAENYASESTGAYAFEGKRLSNNAVSVSLKHHFEKWKPYIKTHGMIIIELHTLPSSLAAQNTKNTLAIAYDATHGYSDQYIVEVDEFLRIVSNLNLKIDPHHFKRFPDSDLATVTVNFIKN